MPLVVFTDIMEINQENIIIINKKQSKSHIKIQNTLIQKTAKKKKRKELEQNPYEIQKNGVNSDSKN